MEAKISTGIGMISGWIAGALTGNIGTAIFMAMTTGAAAYIGQQIAKYIHKKIKRK